MIGNNELLTVPTQGITARVVLNFCTAKNTYFENSKQMMRLSVRSIGLLGSS